MNNSMNYLVHDDILALFRLVDKARGFADPVLNIWLVLRQTRAIFTEGKVVDICQELGQ